MAGPDSLMPIPQPPEHLYGLLGNIPDIDSKRMTISLARLVAEYGPIFKLNVLSKYIIVVCSQELVNEMCDEKRFGKKLSILKEIRLALHDGMITANTTDHNWKLAHKLLMRGFGPMAIRAMFPKVLDITAQMLLKWDHLRTDEALDVTDSFTRLSLDIIALTMCNYRLNSFYSKEQHPFVVALMSVMWEASRRSKRSRIENALRIFSWKAFQKHAMTMHDIADSIINDRKRNPTEEEDLLNLMLTARDSVTGEGLPEENIRYNVETMLAAGHETTSGLLSFTCWLLLSNPDKLQNATTEVDSILGDENLTVEHLPRFKYLDAVLKESLRLHPPAAQIGMGPVGHDGVLAGKYPYSANDTMIVNLVDLHKDPKVWGADAAAFRPERMLDGGFERLPPNSWKPFGNGVRTCIGRDFAIQEAIMTMALILQRFEIRKADPAAQLIVEQTVTQKPVNFFMKVKRRPGKGPFVGVGGDTSGKVKPLRQKPIPKPLTGPFFLANSLSLQQRKAEKSFAVFYGSNTGTCKMFAEVLTRHAASLGLIPSETRILDSATDNLPRDKPMIIITASYEGKPTDDSKAFVSWLETLQGNDGSLAGVRFSVLGIGNPDWTNSYHRVPIAIDSMLAALGAERFAPIGLANVAEDVQGGYEDWAEGVWKAFPNMETLNSPAFDLQVHSQDRLSIGQETVDVVVRGNKEISSNKLGFAKMHTELELPANMTYTTGDYLQVLPTNNPATIRRVLAHFSLPEDSQVSLRNSIKSYLPNKSDHLWTILAHAVELNALISRTQLLTLAAYSTAPSESAHLTALSNTYISTILPTRTTILDALESHPSCALPLSTYIDMLPPLKPRQYSISSSPLASPETSSTPLTSSGSLTSQPNTNTASLTYDIVTSPSLANPSQTYLGVASTFLASRTPGQKIRCSIRTNKTNFHLPADPRTPIILIAAGSGIAPMRGFLQERAALAGVPARPTTETLPLADTLPLVHTPPPTPVATSLGPCLFYFGCRHPSSDYVYADELAHFEKQNLSIVNMRPTFSHAPEESGGFRYVQERLWAEREEARSLLEGGAKVFICGRKATVGVSVEECLVRIWAEGVAEDGTVIGEKRARAWVEGMKGVGLVSDVFG